MPDWWKISRPTGETTRVDLYDGIGMDDAEFDFLKGLQDIKTPKIDLHVNSDGGDIASGLAIFNSLKAHSAFVTAYVDSIAASIASVIVMGANKVIMSPGSLMMIHNGRAGVGGEADRLRSVADQLDKMTGVIAGLYAEKTKKPVDQIRTAMNRETWFDAEDAKAFGLCDEISGKSTIENTTRAMSAVMRLHHLPEKFRQTAERMVAQHELETPMNTPKVYMKDGKHFVDIDGKPFEVTVSPAPEITQTVAQIDTTALKAQLDAAKGEGQKAEREYRDMFDTVVATAKIEGEQLTQFTKLFYGQSKDVLSFHATNRIAERAQAVGGGGLTAETDPTKDPTAKEYVEMKNGLTKRWDTDRDIRCLFKCQSNDPNSEEYRAKFQLYMRAELKCAADQKNPIRDRNNDGDRVGRLLGNSSLLTK